MRVVSDEPLTCAVPSHEDDATMLGSHALASDSRREVQVQIRSDRVRRATRRLPRDSSVRYVQILAGNRCVDKRRDERSSLKCCEYHGWLAVVRDAHLR